MVAVMCARGVEAPQQVPRARSVLRCARRLAQIGALEQNPNATSRDKHRDAACLLRFRQLYSETCERALCNNEPSWAAASNGMERWRLGTLKARATTLARELLTNTIKITRPRDYRLRCTRLAVGWQRREHAEQPHRGAKPTSRFGQPQAPSWMKSRQELLLHVLGDFSYVSSRRVGMLRPP